MLAATQEHHAGVLARELALRVEAIARGGSEGTHADHCARGRHVNVLPPLSASLFKTLGSLFRCMYLLKSIQLPAFQDEEFWK